MPQYSVIIPTYNNAICLEDLYQQLDHFFQSNQYSFEVIFIDDCSTDKTWETIKELKIKYSSYIKGAKLKDNSGQQKATLCGFNFAEGDFIITIDDDLQMPPSEIKKLIDKQKTNDFDIVYGNFLDKKHSIIKNLGSIVIKNIQKKVFKIPYGFSGFRLIKNSVVKKVVLYNEQLLFLDTVLMIYTKTRGFANVFHDKRKEGATSYTFFKLSRIFFDFIKSVFQIKKGTKKSYKPNIAPFIIEEEI